jgi:hypothetical protein
MKMLGDAILYHLKEWVKRVTVFVDAHVDCAVADGLETGDSLLAASDSILDFFKYFDSDDIEAALGIPEDEREEIALANSGHHARRGRRHDDESMSHDARADMYDDEFDLPGTHGRGGFYHEGYGSSGASPKPGTQRKQRSSGLQARRSGNQPGYLRSTAATRNAQQERGAAKTKIAQLGERRKVEAEKNEFARQRREAIMWGRKPPPPPKKETAGEDDLVPEGSVSGNEMENVAEQSAGRESKDQSESSSSSSSSSDSSSSSPNVSSASHDDQVEERESVVPPPATTDEEPVQVVSPKSAKAQEMTNDAAQAQTAEPEIEQEPMQSEEPEEVPVQEIEQARPTDNSGEQDSEESYTRSSSQTDTTQASEDDGRRTDGEIIAGTAETEMVAEYAPSPDMPPASPHDESGSM